MLATVTQLSETAATITLPDATEITVAKNELPAEVAVGDRLILTLTRDGAPNDADHTQAKRILNEILQPHD